MPSPGDKLGVTVPPTAPPPCRASPLRGTVGELAGEYLVRLVPADGTPSL